MMIAIGSNNKFKVKYIQNKIKTQTYENIGENQNR